MTELKSFQKSKNVMLSVVDDGAVLLHVDRGVYYGLNEIGTRIWALISQGESAEACVAQIVSKYDVDLKTATRDYQKLTNELLSQGLVSEK